jgi:PEP-CTERM motif
MTGFRVSIGMLLLLGGQTGMTATPFMPGIYPGCPEPYFQLGCPDYTFTQAGYPGATSVWGWFSGKDQNADGYLTAPELTDLQFSYSLNSDSFESLAVNVSDMLNGGGFRFKIGGELLGDDLGEFVAAGIGGLATAGFSYRSDVTGGVFVSPPDFPIGTVSTQEPIHVAPIPEPSTLALLLAGLAAIGLGLKRGRGFSSRSVALPASR